MLADFHAHSSCSFDGQNTMYEMGLAAAQKGFSILCITDHVDLDDHRTGLPLQDCYPHRDKMARQYAEATEKLEGKIDLRLGIELGEANHAPDSAARIASYPELDFIIGSLHNLREMPDFYWIDYKSEAQCRELAMRYVEESFEIVRTGSFDVLGHFGYVKRYMKRKGFNIGIEGAQERLRELFPSLIAAGRGVEVNTSGFRDGTGTVFPEQPFLKLYRELGGEIVTLGSDSHETADVGSGIAEGQALLRELGFKYFTVFNKRKPEFIALD